MPLVDYSDSEASGAEPDNNIVQSGKDPHAPSRKRKRDQERSPALPPLPGSFHDLYASTVRSSNQDDPSLHNGRQRQTPHIEGHWPTHVYIEWHPSKAESARIRQILDRVDDPACLPEKACVHSLLKNDLGTELPLHISLSRSLSLLTDQRQRFIDTVTKNTSRSGARPFEVSIKGLSWVANYEGNRWFLVMQLAKPVEDGLNKLLQVSNWSAQAFNQPWLYSEAKSISVEPCLKKSMQRGSRSGSGKQRTVALESDCAEQADMSSNFHISIGWSLAKPTEDAVRRLDEVADEELSGIKLDVNCIKIKIGNAVTAVPLKSGSERANGIFQI
ncbi:MAG: hypothetical protein Q9191_006414 [Dirinaria sp. TL-2023a]